MGQMWVNLDHTHTDTFLIRRLIRGPMSPLAKLILHLLSQYPLFSHEARHISIPLTHPTILDAAFIMVHLVSCGVLIKMPRSYTTHMQESICVCACVWHSQAGFGWNFTQCMHADD